MTSSGKVIRILLVVAVLILLISVYRSCRSGSRPPAESGTLNETSARSAVVEENGALAFADTADFPPRQSLRESDKA